MIIILKCSSIVYYLVCWFLYMYLTSSSLVTNPFPCRSIPDCLSTLSCLYSFSKHRKSNGSDIIYINYTSFTRICWIRNRKGNIGSSLIQIKGCLYVHGCCCGTYSSIGCEISENHRCHDSSSTVSNCSVKCLASCECLCSCIYQSSREYSCVRNIECMNVSTRCYIEISSNRSNSKCLRNSRHSIN